MQEIRFDSRTVWSTKKEKVADFLFFSSYTSQPTHKCYTLGRKRSNGFFFIFAENNRICPEICRFYGIIIKMFFKPKEYEPAHIHAIYNEYVGIFDIHSFEMIDGDL